MRLTDRIAGPITRCRLDVAGTGLAEQGDGTVNYSVRRKVLSNTDPEADRW